MWLIFSSFWPQPVRPGPIKFKLCVGICPVHLPPLCPPSPNSHIHVSTHACAKLCGVKDTQTCINASTTYTHTFFFKCTKQNKNLTETGKIEKEGGNKGNKDELSCEVMGVLKKKKRRWSAELVKNTAALKRKFLLVRLLKKINVSCSILGAHDKEQSQGCYS